MSRAKRTCFCTWPRAAQLLQALLRTEISLGKSDENSATQRETKLRSLQTAGTMEKNKLVGGWATPLKNMSLSLGMMTFQIYGKIKVMFQSPPTRLYMGKPPFTTNQSPPTSKTLTCLKSSWTTTYRVKSKMRQHVRIFGIFHTQLVTMWGPRWRYVCFETPVTSSL